MGWRDLLQVDEERVTVPWIGGRSLRTHDRHWTIEGRLPQEHGWFTFSVKGRKVRLEKEADPMQDLLRDTVRGYLVGDRLVPDGVPFIPTMAQLAKASEPVVLLEPGLDRFVRVSAGHLYDDGPLVFRSQEFPLGPEDAVLQAYLDERPTVAGIPGVSPALDMAFRLETWRRTEAARIRREEEERQRQEEARAAREARMQELMRLTGTA